MQFERDQLDDWDNLETRNEGDESLTNIILKGDIAGNSNPIHPALVHLPLTLFPLAAFLRYAGTTDIIPQFLNSSPDFFFKGAHYINALGLIASVPVAITGLVEYFNMKTQNIGAKRTVQKHMIVNTIVLLLSLYNFMSLRNSYDFTPSLNNLIVGLFVTMLITYSGHQGGKLVYRYGVGVQRQGESPGNSNDHMVLGRVC